MQTLKTYSRTLFKNKALASINIIGLALGMSSCLLITLYVVDELSFDSYNQNLDRIYRITTKFISEASVDHTPLSASPLSEALKQNFPEVEEVVRFNHMGDGVIIKRGDSFYKQEDVWKADTGLFSVFSYELLAGDPQQALKQPRQVVLTKSLVQKYFGSEDPMGKTITIDKKEHLVTGVMNDLPSNSDLKFSMLISMDSAAKSGDWFDFDYYTYILFSEKSIQSPDFQSSFERKLGKIADDKINSLLRKETQTLTATLYIQPLKGLHFEPALLYDTPKGNMNYVYVFSSVAILILLIGCLNYINFSIVQSIERSKEVGIRKAIGASFWQLVVKYIGESFMITFLALILAGILVTISFPLFNEITAKDFGFTDLFGVRILLAIAAILLIVGILAGSYPAFYTSSIKAVLALKGKMSTPKGQFIRKVSITTQFIISIGLIISTVIVYSQMSYIKNYDLGFRKDNVMVIPTPTDSTLRPKIKAFKENLLRNTEIESVSLASYGSLPGADTQRGSITFKSDGKDEVRMVNNNHVDEDYIPLFNIKIIEGRNFDGRESDMENSVLVNESLVKMMGWKNPLEQKVGDKNIIGVTGDFHYMSLYNRVEPQVTWYNKNIVTSIFIAWKGKDIDEQISLARKEWNALFEDEAFTFKFLDESLSAQYSREDKAMSLFTYFSALTIAISCLGLFGLSSLTVYQRKKEIGIRKVVGAGFRSIVFLFSKEYLALIVLALAITSPITWYAMRQWLESFLYRTELSIYIYAGVGFVVIGLSLITILLSITKISNTKPSDLIGE